MGEPVLEEFKSVKVYSSAKNSQALGTVMNSMLTYGWSFVSAVPLSNDHIILLVKRPYRD